jgi:conjugal transfer pilus assembly protein TraB
MLELNKKNATKTQIKHWFDQLDPNKKRLITTTAVGGGILLVSSLLVLFGGHKPIDMVTKKTPNISILNGKKPQGATVDVLSGQVKKLTDELSTLKESSQRQNQQYQDLTKTLNEQTKTIDTQTQLLQKQASELQGQLAETKQLVGDQQRIVDLPPVPLTNKKTSGGMSFADQDEPNTLNNQATPVADGPRIKEFTSKGVVDSSSKSTDGAEKVSTERKGKIQEFVNVKSGKNGLPDMFLPAGSIMSGTLITGLDAPTSNQARRDPFPALLRIKSEAILPNRYKMDIRECFLIASGYGDMSSERAYLRAERMSCIKNDGAVIESSMDAYSVGEDGKAGIRGRLVSKNGQIIGNALMSGFVAGITHAFSPQSVQSINTSPVSGANQAFQYPSPQLIAGQAMAGGVQGAAQQIAGYYLAMARNIFPIIEVDAGRKIDFVMIRGISLNPKVKGAQDQNPNQNTRSNNNLMGQNQQVGGQMMQMMNSNLKAIGPLPQNNYGSMFGSGNGGSNSYGYNGMTGSSYMGGGGYFQDNSGFGGN